MVIEHFGENTKYRSIIFVAEPLNINIKKNRFCLTLCRIINQHKSSRVIREFFTKAFDGTDSIDCLILKNIREHF